MTFGGFLAGSFRVSLFIDLGCKTRFQGRARAPEALAPAFMISRPIYKASGGSRILRMTWGGGAPTLKLGLIYNFLTKNCMKMKEFGPPGGTSLAPLRSANEGSCNNFGTALELPDLHSNLYYWILKRHTVSSIQNQE